MVWLTGGVGVFLEERRERGNKRRERAESLKRGYGWFTQWRRRLSESGGFGKMFLCKAVDDGQFKNSCL